MDILSIKIYWEGGRSMKTKLMKRSLCLALVAVMLLGLSVINASACSHSSVYWEFEDSLFDYYLLDDLEHDVCKSDVANCKLCGDIFTYCTHWYSEPHDLEVVFWYSHMVYDGGDPYWVSEYKNQCKYCDYAYAIGFCF